MDLCANHCSPGRIEHCAVEVAAVLREQISADAQCCKEEDVSPAIHKPRIASGTKAKQCTLSQESDDNCHRLVEPSPELISHQIRLTYPASHKRMNAGTEVVKF